MSNNRLGIRLDDELQDKLKLLQDKGYNVSAIARIALNEYVDRLLNDTPTRKDAT